MDSPAGVEKLNDSLSYSSIISKFMETYGVIKYELAHESSNA